MMSNCKLCLADCAFKGKDMKKGNCKGYIPMSNADRIRAMSDEELADFLDKCEAMGYQDSSIARDKIGNCVNMLEWLRQPAEED